MTDEFCLRQANSHATSVSEFSNTSKSKNSWISLASLHTMKCNIHAVCDGMTMNQFCADRKVRVKRVENLFISLFIFKSRIKNSHYSIRKLDLTCICCLLLELKLIYLFVIWKKMSALYHLCNVSYYFLMCWNQ